MTEPHKCLISVDAANMTAVVCPWCEDYREGANWAADHGIKVTNDRCEDCTERFKAEMKCERASRNPFAAGRG